MEVLFDDLTGVTNGAKLMAADMIGIPTRVIVSAKTLAANSVEVKRRKEKQSTLVALENLSDRLVASGK